MDKKLETWVKESGFLGGVGGGGPTVVTPKLYRQRFVSAMERYFPLVTPAFLGRPTVKLIEVFRSLIDGRNKRMPQKKRETSY